MQVVRERYKGALPNATNAVEKLTYKYTLNEVKNLLSQDISVLLYELTTKYSTFNLSCENQCQILVDGVRFSASGLVIKFGAKTEFTVTIDDQMVNSAHEITVQDSESGLVTVENYDRKSYAGIPRNTFRGKLIFTTADYKTVDGTLKNDRVVINQLLFADYLK